MANGTVSRSADFLATIGVDTHVPYTDGGYANVANIAADLKYLGISEVRDGITDGVNGSAPLSSYIQLAQQGIKFTIVIDGTVAGTAGLNAQLALITRLVQAVPGSVVAVEGANEINNFPKTYNGVSGLQGALNLQKDLYAAVHSNPALGGIAVDYFTGYDAGSVGVGPDPSKTGGLADFDTQHPYPINGDAPGVFMNSTNAAPNETPGQIGPIVYTETGYSSNGGTGGAVNTTVQAHYTLDLLLDAMQNNVAHTDLYQLMDAYSPGSRQGDDGFGLFDSNGQAKLAATAIHNLGLILADAASNATTFKTGNLTPTFTGLPATGNDIVLEKANGTFDILVWAEPQIWNAATGTEIAAPTENVTVSLGNVYSTVSIYDPLAGSTPLQTLTNVSSVQIGVSDHPVIIELGSIVSQPAVAITSQHLVNDSGASSADGITNNGAVTLTGTVTGASGTSVEIFDGKTALGAATLGSGGSWTFATTLAAGTHNLVATATDPQGATASSAVQSAIIVETASPSVGLSAETQTANTTNVVLAGTVSASATAVTVYSGSTALGAATLDGKGGWTYTASSLAAGSYSFHASASDIAGNVATTASQSFTVRSVVTQPTPPVSDMLVLALSEDAYNGNAQFTVSVDGKQVGGVQSVTALHSAGQSQDFTIAGNFGAGSHTIGINFLNDAYLFTSTGLLDRNLYVNSITLDGNVTTENAEQMNGGVATYTLAAQSSRPVTPPTVSVTSQHLANDSGASSADGITNNGAVTLTGTVTGASGTSVEIFDGKTALGAATLGSGGSWTFATTLAAGTHNLVATATDPQGATASSAVQSAIIVETASPSVGLSAETQTANTTNVVLAGTVSASATAVTVYSGSTALGAATLDGKGGWTYTASSLAAGSYSFHASASDIAGNVATTASQSFTVRSVVTQPTPPVSDMLVLALSEDAYNGNAQFTVSVDGKQVGGVQSVTALHSAGQSQDFTIAGNFGAGSHTIGINFLNDAYLFTSTGLLDRNLYVNSITLDGNVTTENAAQLSQGLANYLVHS